MNYHDYRDGHDFSRVLMAGDSQSWSNNKF